MIHDKLNLFSDAQAITSAAASDSVIDLGEVRDIGTGEPLYIVAIVDVAFTDASSNSTLTVALEGDSTESFTPDGTQDLFTFSALSAAGTKKIARLDPGADPLQYRYIRLKYTPNNGDLTTGSVTAFLCHNVDKYTAYADNIVIS
jgi:hypothetical protein